MNEILWHANKFMMEKELEEFLSCCPNMTPEDTRDYCRDTCPLFSLYCISIEPSEAPMEIRGLEETAN